MIDATITATERAMLEIDFSRSIYIPNDWYKSICYPNGGAALPAVVILSSLINGCWTREGGVIGIDREGLLSWRAHKTPGLCNALAVAYSLTLRQVDDHLNLLEGLHFLHKAEPMSDLEIVEALRSKTPRLLPTIPGVKERCQWCCSDCLIPHDHHYPVRRKDDGQETVRICPDCHSEFHFMEAMKSYRAGYALLESVGINQ